MESKTRLRFLTSGRSEYRFNTHALRIGDVLTRDGSKWIVVDVRADRDGDLVVTVKPLDGDRGATATA